MRSTQLLIFFLLCSCWNQKSQVTIIKQWHLTPQTSTKNIEKAKEIPQFENQKYIYEYLVKEIENGKVKTIVAEGCEGEMSSSFTEAFNGWSLSQLKELVNQNDYADILAPVAMKLKARFPEVSVICGDNEKLVSENLKAASDMRGFFSFYKKLKDLKEEGDQKTFNYYATKLKELYPDGFKENKALKFAREGVLKSLEEFEVLLERRNAVFEEVIIKHQKKSPVVIIGGLHVADLSRRLRDEKLDVTVITPDGYRDDEAKLLSRFKTFFATEDKLWTEFMMPEGFMIKKFDLSNTLAKEQVASENEYKELVNLLEKSQLDSRFILSDFDEDGIRDFTLSLIGERLIISPEDLDWDNDGIPNLVDQKLGTTKIANLSKKVSLANNYLSQKTPSQVVESLKKSVDLIQESNTYHELLVLEVLEQLVKKVNLSTKNINFLRASNLNISKGRNNFFNYVKPEKTINYDAKKLNVFVKTQFKKNFKGADYKTYINSFVIPLIIHSITHEVGHSLGYDFEELAKSRGWTEKSKLVKSPYLKLSREKERVRKHLMISSAFEGKVFEQWQIEAARSKDPFFILNKNLLSLYSTHSMEEWFAELYSLCLFKKVYPKSDSLKGSQKWVQLLGVNPSAVSADICLSF